MRVVAHLDLDAFFASVEERDKPYLKGAPIIVGADPAGGKGRGVAATASYAARAYGIRSATPIRKAWQLCEEAKREGKEPCVFIVPRFGKYEKASGEVFGIVRSEISHVEQVSVDEAYMELSGINAWKEAEERMHHLKAAIKEKTGLIATIGIGPNKLAAKLASEAGKPNGLFLLTEKKLDTFMKPLLLKEIPGIGRVSAARFLRMNMKTVQDARALSWKELQNMFGTHGFTMYERLWGIDPREIEVEDVPPLSIGKMHTFDVDIHTLKETDSVVSYQVERIMHKLKSEGYTGFRGVTVTVRFEDFETHTKSIHFQNAKHSKRDLELAALKLLIPFFEKTRNPKKKAVRLIGLRVEKLV